MGEQEHFEGMVVPTTHWDRDWYWSFERFRVKLMELFTGLKDLWENEPDYIFTTDGQTILVEDYLDALPEDRALLVEMGKAGRLRMGPLYVLSDVYCTGGEALIRNMLLGAAQADAFHARSKVFYLPDTFGLTPECPMLAKGFGYDCIIFTRGLPEKASDPNRRFYTWRAADGSEAMMYRLFSGYGNFARLGRTAGTGGAGIDEWTAQPKKGQSAKQTGTTKITGIHPGFSMSKALEHAQTAVDRFKDAEGAPHLLLAGVDHQIPQPELPEILRQASNEQQRFRYAGLDEVADAMRARSDRTDWPVYEGECHGDYSSQILGGTVSSRIYLKHDNAAAEERLFRVAEPATALLHHLGNRDALDGICREAWRQLLRCHPHDDITGCSCDLVHRENEAAIARASQAGDAIRRRAAFLMVQAFGGQTAGDERPGFICHDASGNGIRGRIEVSIDFEGRMSWADCPPPAAYRLVDQEGNAVPFRELDRHHASEHPHMVLDLELQVDIRAGGLRRYFFEAQENPPITDTQRCLENDLLRATVNDDGTVDLLHKPSGKNHPGLGSFSDQADGGDEYCFSPIPDDVETVLENISWQRGHEHGCQGLQCIVLHGKLRLPADSSVQGRSRDLIDLPLSIAYSLAPDDEALQVRIDLDNCVKDHRLRWNLSAPAGARQSRAGLKYHSIERPIDSVVENREGKLEIPIHPCDHYVCCDDEDGSGLAVFCPCPMNYEIVTDDAQPRLALTILRAVGILSQGHMTRGPGAGPDIRTPEAQCLRPLQFRFALRPYQADERDRLFELAWRWRQQPIYGVLWGADPDWDGSEPEPMLAIEPGPIVINACKRSQDRQHGIIRLFNSGSATATTTLRGSILQRLLPARLDEQPNGDAEIQGRGGDFCVSLPGQGLATFIID